MTLKKFASLPDRRTKVPGKRGLEKLVCALLRKKIGIKSHIVTLCCSLLERPASSRPLPCPPSPAPLHFCWRFFLTDLQGESVCVCSVYYVKHTLFGLDSRKVKGTSVFSQLFD
jgi:hypothetical protein